MTANQRFEIKARAFHIMTGLLAPGKDSPAAAGRMDEAIQEETWMEWSGYHDQVIRAMLQAFEEQNL